MKDKYEERKQRMRERVEYLHSENEKLHQKIGQLGIGINPQDIKDMRFELLIKVLLGEPDDEARLEFEERFQEMLNGALERTHREAEKQSRLSRLHVPGRENGSRP